MQYNQGAELDETTFFETETRPRPGLDKISRPRRDREFCKMISRDRDNTETRNLDQEIREIETETRVSSNPDSFSLFTMFCYPSFKVCFLTTPAIFISIFRSHFLKASLYIRMFSCFQNVRLGVLTKDKVSVKCSCCIRDNE